MKTIDWEQRRYEISAKEVLPSLLKIEKLDEHFAASLAIGCADALINKLKK